MQNQPNFIELLYSPIPLDPNFAISRAGEHTHCPEASVTYLHYHDSLEIGYCYRGSGVFIVDDRILPFTAGCASVIFKNEIHIAQSSAEYGSEWKFLNLDPTLLLGRTNPDAAWLLQPDGRGYRSIVPPDDSSGLAIAIRELIEESNRGDAASVPAMKGLALCVLARLSRQMPEDAAEGNRPAKSLIGAVSSALDYILKNHAQPIYIAELARACGLSVTAFRRAFFRAMGIAPNDYIHKLRIQLASMQLAYSAFPVLDIAFMVGYDSLSGFNRHFKQITGSSPREYRKSAQMGKTTQTMG